MSTFMKKNWFICLLIVALAGTSCYVIYDTNKGKLKGKSVNGSDIVYSVNDVDYTTEEFYDQLYKFSGFSPLGQLFVVNLCESQETTEDMQQFASNQAAQIITNYRQQYPSTYQDLLNNALRSAGYSGYEDLEKYVIDYQKQQKIIHDYCEEHFDELQIRNVSYILIKFEDEASPEGEPTLVEEIGLHEVDASLENGESFEDVAKQYSQDTSTAYTGGVLGTIDNQTTTLDEAFLKAALALKEGEISDWVYSSNFGYFRIKNNASTPESLNAFVNKDSAEGYENDPYTDLISSYDTTLTGKAIWAKAQEVGYDFMGDESMETQLKTFLGVTE
ncbi:MAG: peptidylprolyl isomerase [Solobacterium sp.]|nr:peptidylprolyl isomerase [Solobacterium sp.]